VSTPTLPEQQALDNERLALLHQVEDWLETPMVALGFVWLGLLVWELLGARSPFLDALSNLIWVVFIFHFLLEFFLAPRKQSYLKRNWLTVISLVIPAFRVFRVARVLRATRGLQLVKIVGSLNRGMNALRASLGRRGFGYVVALTALVTLAGAAGMFAFERDIPNGLTSYGEALWWTAMLMTTLGSQYWPQSPEGRVLCVMLALYAFAVFGYVTATLATHFVGRDAADTSTDIASERAITDLRAEITALRAEIRALSQHNRP
jgi:voltage-gated potassium channel